MPYSLPWCHSAASLLFAHGAPPPVNRPSQVLDQAQSARGVSRHSTRDIQDPSKHSKTDYIAQARMCFAAPHQLVMCFDLQEGILRDWLMVHNNASEWRPNAPQNEPWASSLYRPLSRERTKPSLKCRTTSMFFSIQHHDPSYHSTPGPANKPIFTLHTSFTSP